MSLKQLPAWCYEVRSTTSAGPDRRGGGYRQTCPADDLRLLRVRDGGPATGSSGDVGLPGVRRLRTEGDDSEVKYEDPDSKYRQPHSNLTEE